MTTDNQLAGISGVVAEMRERAREFQSDPCIYSEFDAGSFMQGWADRLEALASAFGARDEARVCAEAYQVVGSLLDDLGKLNTPEAEKILDNLSEAKMVHKDVLPWPSFSPPVTAPGVEVVWQFEEVDENVYVWTWAGYSVEQNETDYFSTFFGDNGLDDFDTLEQAQAACIAHARNAYACLYAQAPAPGGVDEGTSALERVRAEVYAEYLKWQDGDDPDTGYPEGLSVALRIIGNATAALRGDAA